MFPLFFCHLFAMATIIAIGATIFNPIKSKAIADEIMDYEILLKDYLPKVVEAFGLQNYLEGTTLIKTIR